MVRREFKFLINRIAGCNLFGIQPLQLGANPGSSSMHYENGRIVETPVEARGGFLDRPSLAVLIVSMGLVIGLFVVIYIGVVGW